VTLRERHAGAAFQIVLVKFASGWLAAVLLRAMEDTSLRLAVKFASDGLPSEAHPKGERRMVDQRGFEPLTS
jgi:hypothetical protein